MSCPHAVGASICRHCSGHDALQRRVAELEAAIDRYRNVLAERHESSDAFAALCAVRDEALDGGTLPTSRRLIGR